MKVLVVGSGAREHALVWKLRQEAEVFATPGNPGIASICQVFDVSASDQEGIVALARRLAVHWVLIGPEDPLIAGLADRLRAVGTPAFGPGSDGAMLEGSKAFSKHLMYEAGVPTAAFETFGDAAKAKAYAASRFATGRAVVVKASGAALGKGVIVCDTSEEANEAIERTMVRREFGEAGSTAVIEDRLRGREFSLLTLCSGTQFLSLPVAQDYKRVGDGDEGPNTGGMGSYSPVPWISNSLLEEAESTIVAPILRRLAEKGVDFRGMLFSGLMVEDEKPFCLEYNVRFGDPETQSIVCRLGEGFAEALSCCARGARIPDVDVLSNAAVSVVAASGGYPGKYARDLPIELPAETDGLIFHAGTKLESGRLVTNGGRVLTVSAARPTIEEARAAAYEAIKAIRFEGMHYRTDIAGGS